VEFRCKNDMHVKGDCLGKEIAKWGRRKEKGDEG
jgi:hypothetical protein